VKGGIKEQAKEEYRLQS